AEATTAASAVTVHRRNGDPTPAELPGSIVRYVARTRQSVILDDATAENPFMSDPYLRERQVRSILCLPLTKQAALVGVLYLENNLAPRVFTPARIQSLTLLASQAAISLENARLFSELQRAEQTVRQDERELRLLFEFVPQHITVLDTDGRRLLDANRAALEYLGFSTIEELTAGGNVAEAMYHPEDVGKVRDDAGGFSAGVAHELEARLRRRDGQYRWYLVRPVPLRADPGRIRRWYVAGRDIDDRKRAEERVHEENLALREELDKASMFEELVGTSRRLQTVLANVARVAPTDSTVLITGETGTGKELVARAIHKRSGRSSR